MPDCYERDQTKHVDDSSISLTMFYDVLLFIIFVASKEVVDAAPSHKKVDVGKWTVDDVTKWIGKIGLG